MDVFDSNRPLLDAFRRGERAALTEVYSRTVDEVASLVRRGFSLANGSGTVPGVADPARQVDLVQDVFLRAFAERARLSFDGLSPFLPWLLRITQNLMIDEGRRLGRLVSLDDVESIVLEGARPLVSPEDELEWNRLRKATVAFCATLGPDHVQFVKLRFELELSQSDVAEQLGVSRRKVRKLESLLRAGLARYLEAGASTAALQKNRPGFPSGA